MKKMKSMAKAKAAIVAALVVAIVASIAVPAYADANSEVATAGTTYYVGYDDLEVTNGSWALTRSGQNYTDVAAVYTPSIDTALLGIQVTTNPAGSEYPISKPAFITGTGYKELTPAYQYPGQYICAGFYIEGITGKHYISGKFYYNGL